MANNPKKYCFNCKHYYTSNWGGTCTLEVGFVDHPTSPIAVYAIPEEDNANNDCQYYLERDKPILKRIMNYVTK